MLIFEICISFMKLISHKKVSSSPCFLFNQRLAHKELLQEAKQARSRAETMGAAGW